MADSAGFIGGVSRPVVVPNFRGADGCLSPAPSADPKACEVRRLLQASPSSSQEVGLVRSAMSTVRSQPVSLLSFGLVAFSGASLARRMNGGSRKRACRLSQRCKVTCNAAAEGTAVQERVEETVQHKLDLQGIVSLCKRRGFVFQSSEIYGGYGGFFDYGPLGVELKNNLKRAWWSRMVHGRDDVVGLDSSIIANPAVHKASGHVDAFSDPMCDCKESKRRFRADQLMWAKVETVDGDFVGCVSAVEDGDTLAALTKAAKKLKKKQGVEGELKPLDMKDMMQASEQELADIPSPATGEPGSLTMPRAFNLMFATNVGPYADASSVSYLRPETAQGIFVNFKNVETTTRQQVPFGIAQVGKAFRNEITPRQFLFRSREFEQLEIEYFIHPEADYLAIQKEWLDEMWSFLKAVGCKEEFMGYEVHEGDGLAHYARACTDIVFKYPFGESELLGVAARGEYDLQQHAKASGQKLDYQVPGKKDRYVPHVIEPSLGVDRLFLAVMCSAYDEDEVGGEKRSLLRFHPSVAPITCGIFPLLKNKPLLVEKAQELAKTLRRKGFNVLYDAAGAIGKRYRRMDEVGTPFCCTIDFETLEDNTVTLRWRDDPLEVTRVPMDEVASRLSDLCELPE